MTFQDALQLLPAVLLGVVPVIVVVGAFSLHANMETRRRQKDSDGKLREAVTFLWNDLSGEYKADLFIAKKQHYSTISDFVTGNKK